MNKEKETILKLNQIVRMGYVPSRGNETYKGFSQRKEDLNFLTNCFGHAVYNLTNKQFDEIDFSQKNGSIFGQFGSFYFMPIYCTIQEFKNFIRKTGLKINESKSDVKLKNNEWLVALYFAREGTDPFERDYHWLLREKDGSWSAKRGYKEEVYIYDKLPLQTGDYDLHNIYKITNPFAEK